MQDHFPKNNLEVGIAGSNGKIEHRADIQLNNKLVIEIQNSPIKIEDIDSRESFYGRNNMLWVINGATLANKSSVHFIDRTNTFSIYIDIPGSYSKFSNYFEWALQNSEVINREKCHYYIDLNEIYVYRHRFDFSLNEDGEYFKRKIEAIFELSWNRYHCGNEKDIINTKHKEYKGTCLEVLDFEKVNWRKFIDHMRFPVFIDNLKGLDDSQSFWYQRNKIISKK